MLNRYINSIEEYEYTIELIGHSDNSGSSAQNRALAERRVHEVQKFIIEQGIKSSLISNKALGDQNPLGDNNTEEGKAQNRRVDVVVNYKTFENNVNFMKLNQLLYQELARKPQEFLINPARDTILRAEFGTIVHIKANTFKVSNTKKGTRMINVLIKESFLKSDMILDNLTTVSNGQILESQGMVYIDAQDLKKNPVKLAKGKSLLVMVPTDSVVPNATLFNGDRTRSDGNMNWTAKKDSEIFTYKLEEITGCGYGFMHYHDLVHVICPFFWCKVKRFFRIKSWSEDLKIRAFNSHWLNDLAECEKLNAKFQEYGVNNYADLIYKMNQPLMDQFGAKTPQELMDTINKLNRQYIEVAYLNRSLNFQDLQYYVYNESRLGWTNLDVFADFKTSELISMRVNLLASKNKDCKLVFKNRRIVLPAEVLNGRLIFQNIPPNEEVFVVVIKLRDGKPYLAITETTTANKIVNVDFEHYELPELKEKLKILDVWDK